MKQGRNISHSKRNNAHSHLNQMLTKVLESENFSASAARTLLALLAFGGIMVVGAMAPNIFSSLGFLGKKHAFDKKFSRKKLQDGISYLRKKKLITYIKKEGNAVEIRITKDGVYRTRKFIISELVIEKPKQWDKKWRVVIFDIPERFMVARNALRRKLQALGFLQLQRIVFIYPYPAEDEILFVASIFGVERYIELLVVEKMLHDQNLRRHFKVA